MLTSERTPCSTSRVSIIRAGRTVETGTLAELRHLTRTTVVAETVESPDGIAAVTGVANLSRLDGRVRFDVDTEHLDEAMSYLAARGIRSLVSHPPTLEELFLRQYGDQVGDAAPGSGNGSTRDAGGSAVRPGEGVPR